MSLSEQRQLVSVTINLSAKTIDVLWMDQVMKNGLVISETPHRGAYPLSEDGEPDESVITLMGKSLADVIGEGFSVSQKNLSDAAIQISKAAEEIEVLTAQLDLANQTIEQKELIIAQLLAQINQ